jgi:hypothetical protein
MQAIDRVAGAEAVSPARPRPAQDGASTARPVDLTGRALAVVEARASTASRTAAERPAAPFLAQLIATAEQLPQTRKRRRADPSEVTTLYATAATPAAWIGGTIYRSL